MFTGVYCSVFGGGWATEADDMEILFKVIVEPDEEDGGFVAAIATLPGVVGQGETEEEAIQDAHAALMFTLESMRERGEELPASDESARELPTFEESRERGFRTELVV